jgi:hypothetical protein
MTKTKGGLLSFNNFLSTSKKSDVSLRFARDALFNPDMVGILFVMKIDPSQSTTPFASIKGISYLAEKMKFSSQCTPYFASVISNKWVKINVSSKWI